MENAFFRCRKNILHDQYRYLPRGNTKATTSLFSFFPEEQNPVLSVGAIIAQESIIN
jgi:hypothetical protein